MMMIYFGRLKNLLEGKKMIKVRVRNMCGREYGKVANQFIIDTEEASYFQSYETVIVRAPRGPGKTQLDKNAWDYSKTTGKYRNKFLGETKKETEAKIANGTYDLVDLNN